MNPWYEAAVAEIDHAAIAQAVERQNMLTKPPGALGVLEALAIQFAGWQGQACPTLDQVQIVVFAADHGIAEDGVSAFPQSVTVEMVRNFARGGAAISVLSRHAGAALQVVNVGTVSPVEPLQGVLDQRIANGTANFRVQAAMTQAQCEQAMNVGREVVINGHQDGMQVFIGGEMGIANTASASALCCKLLDLPASALTGAGTGLDDAGIVRKTDILQAALDRCSPDSAWSTLCEFGGFEIAALVGAYIAAAQLRIPVLVDGFITSAAALIASKINPASREWMLFSHCSAEKGHKTVLDALSARPILSLDMRLGEGSGAALALSTLKQALVLHGEMATFAEASVSEKL